MQGYCHGATYVTNDIIHYTVFNLQRPHKYSTTDVEGRRYDYMTTNLAKCMNSKLKGA